MKIKRWLGRFGNVVQQITNSIYFCETKNITLHVPKFGYDEAKDLTGSRMHHNKCVSVISNFQITNRYNRNESKMFFYHNGEMQDHMVEDHSVLEENRRSYCMEYIYPNSFLKDMQINSLEDDHLVIHLRSGDIMDKNRARKIEHVYTTYKTNPLSFYCKLIPSFSEVTIVTQTKNNFIVDKLVRLFPWISIQSGSFIQDITMLLSAKHLASSGVGTFPIASALLSSNLKTFYHTDLYDECHINPLCLQHVKCVEFQTPKGYLQRGWNNNEEDIECVLNN